MRENVWPKMDELKVTQRGGWGKEGDGSQKGCNE